MSIEKIKSIQGILGVEADGRFGPKSQAALDDLVAAAAGEIAQPAPGEVHEVIATSFADPEDVAAFRRCKANGNTDKFCFGKGDNAVGCWGDKTDANVPMCALPPEKWRPFEGSARGKLVLVKCGGKEVVCQLRDTMPHEASITNGAGIDLNPAAWRALGHEPPVKLRATWQWV